MKKLGRSLKSVRVHSLVFLRVALLLLVAPPDLGASTGSELQSGIQRFSRVIEIAPTEGEWVQFPLDRAILERSAPDLSDLRIVDVTGLLLPYRLRSPDPMETRWARIDFRRLDWKPNPGGGWIAELEVVDLHDRAILLVDEPGVRIESRNPVSPSFYPEERAVGPRQSAFVLPGGNSRWKLFTSRSSSQPRADAEFYEEQRTPRTLDEVEYLIEHSDSEAQAWAARLELVGPARSIAAVDIHSETGVVTRAEVSVETPDGRWYPMSTGLTLPGFPHSAPGVTLDNGTDGRDSRIEWTPDLRTKRLRLRLYGTSGPEAPIEIRRVLAVPDEVEFRATGAAPFRILYGDDQLRAANYEIAPPEFLVPSRITARLGPEEPNPFASPPGVLEWLRRHPFVLSAALFVVLGLLAVFALSGRIGTSDDQKPAEAQS